MFAEKNCHFLLLLVGSALVMASPVPDSCELPNCRRPGPSIPGSLKPNEVPQMVVLTFTEGVRTEHLKYFNEFFGKNPNGCPRKYTFFTSDFENNEGETYGNEYNASTLLANMGHELASHSLSHRFPGSFWSGISAEDYKREMVGMRTKLAQLSGATVSGARTPFFELNADVTYQVLQENGFVWDSSMVAGSLEMNNDELPTWPFTLDEPVSEKYCANGKCPKGRYPGFWEFPLNRIYNKQKEACSVIDICDIPDDPKEIQADILQNFYDQYYSKNRAPFGFFLPVDAYQWPPMIEITKSILEEVTKLNDVYFVTVSQAIDWVRNPTPLSQISNLPSWNC